MTQETLLIVSVMGAGRCLGFVAGLLFANAHGRVDGAEYFLRLVVIMFLSLLPLVFLDFFAALSIINYYIAVFLLATWLTLLGLVTGVATVYRGRDAGIGRALVMPSVLPGADLLIAAILMSMGSETPPHLRRAQEQQARNEARVEEERKRRLRQRQKDFERARAARPIGFTNEVLDPDVARYIADHRRVSEI